MPKYLCILCIYTHVEFSHAHTDTHTLMLAISSFKRYLAMLTKLPYLLLIPHKDPSELGRAHLIPI